MLHTSAKLVYSLQNKNLYWKWFWVKECDLILVIDCNCPKSLFRTSTCFFSLLKFSFFILFFFYDGWRSDPRFCIHFKHYFISVLQQINIKKRSFKFKFLWPENRMSQSRQLLFFSLQNSKVHALADSFIPFTRI